MRRRFVFWMCYLRCLVSIASVIGKWMSVEHWWNDTARGKPKYWERKLSVPLCAFYPTWSGIELGSPRWKRMACELWIGKGELEEIGAIFLKGTNQRNGCEPWAYSLFRTKFEPAHLPGSCIDIFQLALTSLLQSQAFVLQGLSVNVFCC